MNQWHETRRGVNTSAMPHDSHGEFGAFGELKLRGVVREARFSSTSSQQQ